MCGFEQPIKRFLTLMPLPPRQKKLKRWHKSMNWPLASTEFDLSLTRPSLFANGRVDTADS